MKKVRDTDYVLMIISDEYLKSPNCMFEVVEVMKDDNYKDRILPIILPNANIYSPIERIEYLQYWEGEFEKLRQKIEKHSPEEVIHSSNDLKIIRHIRLCINEFLSIISDLKNIPVQLSD